MDLTHTHACILAQAFENVLGQPETGAVAYVRCLSPDLTHDLPRNSSFSVEQWKVFCVAGEVDPAGHVITADRAVELRETKGEAILLLVDTEESGAGMDGIYSAAREVKELDLFREALRLAFSEMTHQLSREIRNFADRALKKARGRGRLSLSKWTEFDFLCRAVAEKRHPGAFLYLLGLWPVQSAEETDASDELDAARFFMDRLMGTHVSGVAPIKRIEGLRLLEPSEEQSKDLEQFLRLADSKPVLSALSELAGKEHLWINALRREGAANAIQNIGLLPWRTKAGKIARWSGLREGDDPSNPPVLTLNPEAVQARDYSQLEVRWKARPDNLEKGTAEYSVEIKTEMNEELAIREVTHSARGGEKCRFNNDDFSDLGEDALISARVIVSVIGNSQIESQVSEEFIIRFGEPPEQEQVGSGKKVRAFSEGAVELENRETVSKLVSDLASSESSLRVDQKGTVTLRPHRGRAFQVFQPYLIGMVEKHWYEHRGALGRWVVQVRSSGELAGEARFVAMPEPENDPAWNRAAAASFKMAARFVESGGSVSQIYDDSSQTFDTVKKYILAWAALLENSDPLLALANTVEVQSLSGRTIGLIVLPSHPLRVAWHAAYDNLVFHSKFDFGISTNLIRDEFLALDGALFPAFLPGLQPGSSFVFADTLGFHAVGMVRDDDEEPKAAVAMLSRALGDCTEAMPTISKNSAKVLGEEIMRYLECHKRSRFLHVHALRAGDGMTVARSLGNVRAHYRSDEGEEDHSEDPQELTPAFVLEFYPSAEQRERGIAGRFINQARERRRSGAGILSPEDSWMLESVNLPGEVRLPRLRWARKELEQPSQAAHLAIAFDTLNSRVVAEDEASTSKPFHVYGLVNSLEREYQHSPSPVWNSTLPFSREGEKHPSDRTHTERLMRLQEAIQSAVARNLGADGKRPALKAEMSPDNTESLRQLHHLCDRVITIDPNFGIEFFDSPQNNEENYETYVIDCVPEREDLGCQQLITSTSNQEEVLDLLAGALKRLGLGNRPRNENELLGYLKSLSGRLAIRLTGHTEPGLDLVSLALCYQNCREVSGTDDCWVSLEDGLLIPAADVHDLLPPLDLTEGEEDETENRPFLVYVSATPRRGLCFQFIEVSCRRHLRAARSPDLINGIGHRIESRRKRWNEWYDNENSKPALNAIRRAKLARVLRFYADRARRHHLSAEKHETIHIEIDRMISKGRTYAFDRAQSEDRGWIFCPEFASSNPLKISGTDSNAGIYLFGPDSLSNSFDHSNSTVDPDSVKLQPALSTLASNNVNVGEKLNKDVEAGKEELDSIQENATSNETPIEVSVRSETDVPTVCFGTEVYGGKEIQWPLTTKGNPHLLLAGLPGMGKTTCLLNLCRQMIEAGVRPLIFSYHQDIDEKLVRLVDSVRYIDCYGLGFNPLQVMDRDSRLAYLDVAGAVRDIFTSIFPELGDIQGERIRRAIKDSFVEKGWDSTSVDLNSLHEPEFVRFVEILKAVPKPDRGLRTLLARLEELEDYGFFELAETRESLWESDQPIVIRIHTTQNENLQKAFASLIFYGLYKDMFRRGIQDHITHAVVFDEAHRAAGLKLIPTMAKECRKYGISLVLASQEAKDFDRSLFSAIANYLVLRLTETDARSLVKMVGSSQQERALIDKIKQMERFRGLYFSEGTKRPSSVALLPVND